MSTSNFNKIENQFLTEADAELQKISDHTASDILENEERESLLDASSNDYEIKQIEPLGFDTKTKDSSENKKYCHILSPQFQIYVSHFFSSWGDRMWMFAGGLFLIEITPRSLRLVAIYEAALSLTVIFLGSAVGRWVDRTSRLTAAQLSLIVQNVMVCVCTFLLCIHTSYKYTFENALNGWAETISQTFVVIFACVAQVGTLGSKIAIEKDWIVVISKEQHGGLSTMNSVLRSVDLSTQMLAPVLVGFVMSSSGMVAGGIVIASWNVVSLLIEYGLLYNLYQRIPALRKPKLSGPVDASEGNKENPKELKGVSEKIKDAAITWKTYFHHEVRSAGLGIAFLYMTVLSFDNFCRAYVYEAGVSKGIIGILTACASLFGIFGSILFPFLRRKLGVLRTGVFGFSFETTCLTLCVVSVFAPGSMFEPSAIFGHIQKQDSVRPILDSDMQNSSLLNGNFTLNLNESFNQYLNISDKQNLNAKEILNQELNKSVNQNLNELLNHNLLSKESLNQNLNLNQSLNQNLSDSLNQNSTTDMKEYLIPDNLLGNYSSGSENYSSNTQDLPSDAVFNKSGDLKFTGDNEGDLIPVTGNFTSTNTSSLNSSYSEVNYTSVILLLTGIIISRAGLWLSDLTVTQILQEHVSESERGGINGVQYSLNQSFGMLRAILIIILPTMETFGYLIIFSFLFVAAANVLFCVYAYKRSRMNVQ